MQVIINIPEGSVEANVSPSLVAVIIQSALEKQGMSSSIIDYDPSSKSETIHLDHPITDEK